MSNASTADTLRSFQNYLGAAFTDATKPWDVFQSMFKYETQSDGMTWTALASVTNTAQAVKAAAGKVYMVIIVSPTAATNGVFVQVYNTAFGGVVVGTTAERFDLFCPATETMCYAFHTAGSANLFGTAISAACTTAAHGATAPAAADLPTVYVLSA